MALNFVGFKDDRVGNARRLFGEPDFYHRLWDARARQEIHLVLASAAGTLIIIFSPRRLMLDKPKLDQAPPGLLPNLERVFVSLLRRHLGKPVLDRAA
jgi:hypothetical protein